MKTPILAILLCAGAITLHAAETSKPDILFVVIDDMNDWTTLFDTSNPIKTPNLERLAQRGTFFSNAYCATPACGPSRTAVLSGFAPTTSGAYENAPRVYRNTLPDDISLPDWFRRNGYAAWGGGKIFHNGGGNDESDRSFDSFFPLSGEPQANIAKLELPGWADFGEVSEELADERTVAAAGAFLKSKTDKPRFTAVGIYKPHLPHYAPPENFKRYPIGKVVMPSTPGDDFSDIPGPGRMMARREYRLVEAMKGRKPGGKGSPEHLVQSYQASADFADEMVGRVLDALDASGRADNTIIVLFGDNGYHLGDKESVSKFTLWEKASHVPFIIVAPGVSKPGSRCETPVGLVNIFPTLTELAGLPAKPGVDGMSLVPLLCDSHAAWDKPAVITMGRGNHAVRTADWRYIRYFDGQEELYDARKDSWNNTNLAGKPECAPVLAKLRASLPKEEVPIPAFFGSEYKAPRNGVPAAGARVEKPVPQNTKAARSKQSSAGKEEDGVIAQMDAAGMPAINRKTPVTPDLYLNFHLMHPGQRANPADPNAGLFFDGAYHLHYIYNPGGGRGEYAFAHVASPDMIHWEWRPTNLHKDFTGHGMFSGTAFLTREGRPAIIYHGQGSGSNQIAFAADNSLEQWEKPVPVQPANPRNLDVSKVISWDPDCFRIGDTYYAIFGNRIGQVEEVPYLAKSTDLENWEYVGPFFAGEPPDVLRVEDLSCANFFPIGDKGKWMLLCISHNLGCRYYLGEWDAKREQFVPESHARMSWPLDWHPLDERSRLNVFAPESLLTPDGRRVMWAWLFELPGGVQTLPRELELPEDGILRIKPLRELNALRTGGRTLTNIPLPSGSKQHHHVADLPGDAVEICAVFDRAKAEHACIGFDLFADKPGAQGFPIRIQPHNRTLRAGASEAPFAVADLPPGEDLELRIFIDKYLVEVFVNDRQAVVGWHGNWKGKSKLHAYGYLEPTEIKELTIWTLKPANEGFLKAAESGIVQ
jgi:beta-fructofuranosidase